ncbi:MAG: ABC transporter permease/M1 family aminopeptidase [Thermoanaerobaculia bacterium]
MLGAIARFEIRYHLRQPLFYILTVIFGLLAFAGVADDDVTIGGGVGNVFRNAPFVTMQFMLVLGVFGVLTTTAFVANAVLRDFDIGIDPLFFSSPIKKWQYLGGRFLGSYFISVLMFGGVALAILLGSFWPGLDPEVLGPFRLWPYVFSLLVLVAPTLFLVGAIFFAIAALTRSLMATYAANVALLVGWVISRIKMRDIENEALAVILDPFGLSAFSLSTRYWTVFEKNTRVLALEGPFLMNRLLWIGVALVILAISFWRFDFAAASRKAKKKKIEEKEAAMPAAVALPRVSQTFGGMSSVAKFTAAVRLEARTVLKSIPFFIIVLLGVMNVWGVTSSMQRQFGTPVYPVTHLMVQSISNGFAIFALLIGAFFAGELVFRERTLKLNEVNDTTPTPTWVMWSAKFVALLLVCVIAILAGIATTAIVQMSKGYFKFQPAVYATGVMMQFGMLVFLIAGLSFVLQILTNNKYVGFLGILLYLVLDGVLPGMGFEHNLYRFANYPPGSYSDMNGWGHFVAPRMWLNLYWALFIAIFLTIGHLLWVRGTESALRIRLREARRRFGAPVMAVLALLLVAFISTGCYIFYNTNVLNEYRTSKDGEKMRADFEKKYKRYENLPQPRITDVQADVAIHPERRAVDIHGKYTLVNKTQQPISELHVMADNDLTIEMSIPGAKLKSTDPELGYWIYTLTPPMAPGAVLPMTFHTSWGARGFVNGDSNVRIVENGTFFNNGEMFPHIGYVEDLELQDRNKRRKHGLKPIERAKPPTNMQARMDNGISRESDWINLDTTVSTSADQIALAPGYLQREWTQNGRRYFHYKTTSPILGFWSYLSARYQVKKDAWKSPDGTLIPIEIYYDAKHPYNVDRMIVAVKKSLDYFTKNFSPYQHKQVRILEFPGYRTFAQSFPNTIPFSESIGFIADLRNPEDSIDYVFYVTAHEVAHQWWAHQVIGGNVQGSTMLVETMAQYSALMVMEKEYGRDKMQRFLRYELDNYLRDRGGELVAEQPLVLVENQPYIHYRKGSLVMYALRDYIGEDAVNRALAKFLRDHAFEGPPYTTATELVKYFRAEAPPQYQETITDLFERITLFDNKTTAVSSTKRADGKYVVKVTVNSTKLRSDAKGEEKPVPVNDLIDIGVFAEKDRVLFSEKRRITKPTETFEIVIGEKPVKAGIDPFNKLIDRNPKDNVKSL